MPITPNVFIVSGRARSGTSMMMQNSVAGGMPAVYGECRDRGNVTCNDDWSTSYDPNPNGYYELCGASGLEAGGIHDWNEYPYSFDGMLLKLHARMLPRTLYPSRPATYKIVYMLRSDAEIEQSMMASWGEIAKYEDSVESIDKIRAFPGVDLIELNYVDVINDPVGQMQRLKDWGWPIDVQLAAATVDPALYRNRGT